MNNEKFIIPTTISISSIIIPSDDCNKGEIKISKKIENQFTLLHSRDIIVARFPCGQTIELKVTGVSGHSEACYMNESDMMSIGAEHDVDLISIILSKPVEILQYHSFRECFDRNLKDPILGKGYYNMGMDTYTCDELTTKDIQCEYFAMKNNLRIFQILTALFGIICIIMTYFVLK